MEVRIKGITFAHAFRERGAVIEKRGIFWRIRMKSLDLQSVFEREKQAILEEITIDKKSSTRRVKVSVKSQQVV